MTKQTGDRVKLRLRFDEALRQQLAEAAKASVRSMNAEIIYRLRTSFARAADEDNARPLPRAARNREILARQPRTGQS